MVRKRECRQIYSSKMFVRHTPQISNSLVPLLNRQFVSEFAIDCLYASLEFAISLCIDAGWFSFERNSTPNTSARQDLFSPAFQPLAKSKICSSVVSSLAIMIAHPKQSPPRRKGLRLVVRRLTQRKCAAIDPLCWEVKSSSISASSPTDNRVHASQNLRS